MALLMIKAVAVTVDKTTEGSRFHKLLASLQAPQNNH